jgi:hypothetical protein
MAKKTTPSQTRSSSKKTVIKAAVKKAPAVGVAVDYPFEGEAVKTGHYSIRLTAAGADVAQVRLDGGEWVECRESVGYFWHDWTPQSGPVSIEARAKKGKKAWAVSPVRVCKVEG